MPLHADRSTRMAAAALIWSGIGGSLLVAGAVFLIPGSGSAIALVVSSGLVLGFLKGKFLLSKMARENGARIASGPPLAWLGDAFAPSSWGIALFFMITGIAVRRSGLPPLLIGFVYIAAGFGLLYASLSAWSAWRLFRAGITEP